MKNDVHIDGRLINQGLLRNVRYLMIGFFRGYLLDEKLHFSIVMYKVSLSKWNY